MDRYSFERMVARAIDELPQEVLEKMANVAIVIEDKPGPEHLEEAGLHPPATLFGLYEGIPLTQRGSGYTLVPPDKITIFQKPIESSYHSYGQIKRAVQRTIIHEIAHHFGISDAELSRLGWG
ncbi:MAG: metallopeptidase family protein [Chloroflexi bacterium]|nr:metallopeptidase family protein [Chloroflexota bacterium]MCL5074332.1 metallopeptidase family protein [Chloroflexota bacterium]